MLKKDSNVHMKYLKIATGLFFARFLTPLNSEAEGQIFIHFPLPAFVAKIDSSICQV